MVEVRTSRGHLDENQQQLLTAGLEIHSKESSAPSYQKDRLNWLVYDNCELLIGILTADLLWDWIYINELWVDEKYRGKRLGKKLMDKAEEYAISHNMTGLWLWTQNWQAPQFYEQLGYKEFCRFDDFPKGYKRIGFRKQVSVTNN